MLLDSSALVALILGEREAQAIFDVLADAPACSVGAPSLLETGMVLAGRMGTSADEAASRLALVMARFEIGVLPFGQEHWPVAWAAFLRYGKGRHPAALNFGDCLTYAVARLARRPLVCLGDDFSRTDLEVVPLPAGS